MAPAPSVAAVCVERSKSPMFHGQAVGVMVASTFMWSIAGVVTRQLESTRSFEVTFWRSFFTVLSLAVLLPLLRGRGAFNPLVNGGRMLWLSGLCWAVMFTAFMVALTLIPVSNVLVTMASGPLLTALFARVFLGHVLALRTWFAIGVAGAGIAWMFATQIRSVPLAGTLVALCVPLAAAVNWTIVQHAQRQGESLDLMPAVLLGGALSALCTAPFAWPFAASVHDLSLLAFLGLVQLSIPCLLVVRCGRVLQAPEMALLGLLEVIFGILLAWWGAGERPGPAVFSGGALVMGALACNELLRCRRAP